MHRRKSLLVSLNTNSKLSGYVTTMVKNYRLFICRVLQFVGFSATKLVLNVADPANIILNY